MILANHGILSSSGGFIPSTLTNDLIALYKAESNANDSLGAYNGTAQGGLTYVSGQSGDAFSGNGTTSYVSLPNDSFNFTGDFSISTWINTPTTAGNQMIFSNMMYNGGARKGYYISLVGDAVEVWLVNQPTFSQYILTSSLISINTWYNIVVTRESGVVKIYVNNSLIATDTNAITMGYISTSPAIGAYTNGLPISRYFNSKIDELNIWNRALTSTEITELQTKFYPY